MGVKLSELPNNEREAFLFGYRKQQDLFGNVIKIVYPKRSAG